MEIENIGVGKYEIKFKLGDSRKTTRGLWAKILDGVDTSKRNGYAFEGEWLRSGGIVSEGDVVVRVRQTGSWRHPGQHIDMHIVEGGVIKELYDAAFNTRGDAYSAVGEIARIFNEIRAKTEGEELIESELVDKLAELVDEYGKEKVEEALKGL